MIQGFLLRLAELAAFNPGRARRYSWGKLTDIQCRVRLNCNQVCYKLDSLENTPSIPRTHQTMTNAYQSGLAKTEANYQPLTPITFLARSARVYPDHVAIVHGNQRFDYTQFYARCRKLASALSNRLMKY